MRRRMGWLGAVAAAPSVQSLVASIAASMGFDPTLAMAVAQAESNFNPNAISSAGAIGVMQLMPATAAQMGVSNPTDPTQNITGGLKYLSMLISQFGGDVSKALAAYNWGPANVQNAVSTLGTAWANALPNETLSYITRICAAANCPGSAFAQSTPADSTTNDTVYASIGPTDTTAAPAAAGWDTQTLFLLAIGAVGVYLFADSVLD